MPSNFIELLHVYYTLDSASQGYSNVTVSMKVMITSVNCVTVGAKVCAMCLINYPNLIG